MKRNVIYFIDEDAAARRANERALSTLLDNAEIEVRSLEPMAAYKDYDNLLASPATAAVILDQRMKASGKVSYNGTDLARYMRGIDGKMPIYILTGHAEDDFEGSEHLVEYVIAKNEIDDPLSEKAKTVKARLLRHLEVFNDVRDAQEQRFHDLLVKSLGAPLTRDEQNEMDLINGETTAAVLAVERSKERELRSHIEKLQTLIGSGKLPL